ncbi:WXG100 family type VII secretion target [Saccharothrix deserti]|uniref:WXG100 family type VII secretion target n=1 Tax=Saccharothrix deserti TaxID=2593674 RepID=UPI00131BD8A3|nr:hypothetical protein [Saccharothrix deserti]
MPTWYTTVGESADAAGGPGDVWAEYFAAPVPTGGVNWDAYTHEELHDMLWQDADVADVGTVAEQWRRHSVELAAQAAELRDQQAALRAGWEGEAAELAGTALGELADRLDAIGAHAEAGRQAAQDAADALARARAAMPPPTGAPGGPETPAFPSLPTAPSVPYQAPTIPTWSTTPTVPTAPTTPSASSTPTWFFTFGAPPTTATGTAFGAAATGGISMYFTGSAASQAKSQAVQAMQGYESSLTGGSRSISSSTTFASRAYGVAGTPRADRTEAFAAGRHGGGGQGIPGAGASPGVPWEQLAGPAPLQPGPTAGVNPRVPTGVPLTPTTTPADPNAGRVVGQGGMAAPVSPRADGEGDRPHRNRMPVIDQELFKVEVPTIAPVIGS